MNNIRVVLAENDSSLITNLKSLIESDDMLCLAGEARDGETAWNLIESTSPDIVITELLIPRMDGLTLVEKINNSDMLTKKPKIIVTSNMSNDIIVRETVKLGVSYFIVKPYNAECIVTRAKNISYSYDVASNAVIDTERIISDYITKFGVPVKLKGYGYLVSAIEEVLNDETMMYGVTKVLYPKVAKRHKSTSVRVEKGIRHAIEVSWKRKSDNMKNESYGGDTSQNHKRPTNSEFIAKVVQELLRSPYENFSASTDFRLTSHG